MSARLDWFQTGAPGSSQSRLGQAMRKRFKHFNNSNLLGLASNRVKASQAIIMHEKTLRHVGPEADAPIAICHDSTHSTMKSTSIW
jgi:hypothetical protein